MIQESKRLVAFIDKNIKRVMKEFAQNTSPWFGVLKAQVSVMDETDLNNIVKTAMASLAADGSQIPGNFDLQRMEPVLRGIVELVKSYSDATSPADYKKMAKSVTRYLRFAWAALNQEAKEIVAFVLIAGYEIQGLPLPFKYD